MHNEQTSSGIPEKIQAQIHAGDLKPRPRYVFIVQMASTVLTALLALLVTLVALSFVLYSVYESGEAFLLGFGWTGILLFLFLFPWGLVGLAVLALLLFQWRLSHIVPSYRIPMLPLFALLIIGTIGLGSVLVPIHSVFTERVAELNVPAVEELYEGVYESREGYGIYRGIVITLEREGFWMRRSDGDADEDDASRFVTVPQRAPVLHEGDEVFILGEQEDGLIHASHLITFPSDDE